MRLIAITGGIASGKSTVARRFGEHGAVVIDADQVARQVVQPGEPALEAIRGAFGDRVIGPDGSLDRPALGAIVFADPEQRAVLNAIAHPAVLERSHALFAAAGAVDPDAVVIYDVPLLVDGHTDRSGEFDTVIAVVADLDERVRRMVEDRGMDEAEARRRIASQADDASRIAIADHVLRTDGTLEETLAAADALWSRLIG